MSCRACEDDAVTAYIRVGNGNVEVVGCTDHLRLLIERNRSAIEAEQTAAGGGEKP